MVNNYQKHAIDIINGIKSGELPCEMTVPSIVNYFKKESTETWSYNKLKKALKKALKQQ